jgi:NAD(P)-dependent dehydrogenase (short-subunit alcohol dehydrogenase family)
MPTVWELFDLTGQVAIVTGGAGQLGSQICDGLAEAGAHVVVASRGLERCQRKAETLTAQGREAFARTVDVTAQESWQQLVQDVTGKFGRIDILVNNAYSGRLGRLEEMTLEDFESATRGALSSVFLGSQAVAPIMKAHRGGVIINISSIYGIVSPDHRIYGRTGMNNPPNYGAAKAGVIQLTRWLATYFAPDGIRVNCISPGGFYNDEFRKSRDYEVFVENYCYKTPLGRMGGETDLKGAAVFLASSASDYVTGHNLVVDGGWTIW